MHKVYTVLLIFAFGMISPVILSGQVSNPVPQPVQVSGILMKLQEFITIPQSSSVKPFTRINLLREAPDESGRLFVCDLRGEFWIIENNETTLYLDISEEFSTFIDAPGKGTGFGAFAFHPEFSTNGKFYTAHSEQTGSGVPDYEPIESNGIVMQWVVYEWTANDPSANAFEGTRRELLRVDYPGSIHGIQEIAFNPTVEPGDPEYGMLYICLGEGGSSRDFFKANVQTTKSFLGTIFRIDPEGDDGPNGQYGIPVDNPFVDDTEPGTIKEIYAYGFRNPHRICWDPEGDHHMIVGDIGEMNLEEVNIVYSGHNYGWSEREGTFLYDRAAGREFVWPLPSDDSMYNYTYPVAQYDHDEGLAIVGGFIYRGEQLPSLSGQYIFGDIPTGKIFHADADAFNEDELTTVYRLAFVDEENSGTNLLALVDYNRADVRFGVDNSGEPYILTKPDGVIRRMTEYDPTATDDHKVITQDGMVFPNPFNNELKLNPELKTSFPAEITFFDLSGKVVLEMAINAIGETITVGSLAPGLYHLQVSDRKQTFVTKVIKK